jgi:hypothetical protein
MEDAPTGQAIRQDSPAGFAGTEPGDTDVDDVTTSPDGWPMPGRRTGGRRYRAGRPSPKRPNQRRRDGEQPQAQTTAFPSGFEGLGTLGGLFACCLASCLLAAWLHRPAVAGLGFCAGCALAAWFCQRAALLRIVVAVPAVFATAEVLTQLVTLPGGGRRGLALPVAGGTLLTLAAVAPWLFAGTAGAVVIALFRGLPRCVRDLRAGLNGWPQGRRAPRGPQAPRSPQALRAQQLLRAQEVTRAPRPRRG